MIRTGISLVVMAALYGALAVLLWRCRGQRRPRGLREAAQDVETAFQQARQTMNEAVGQSWRNLTG